jgi:hypothetical protein
MRGEVALIVVIEKAARNATLKLSSTIAFYKFRPQEREREIFQTFTLKKSHCAALCGKIFALKKKTSYIFSPILCLNI